MKSGNKRLMVRDISWLSFNARVLQEAADPSVHILNRLRFVGIFSNNLDEFFRVRVATLSNMVRLGKSAKVHLEENPQKILEEIQEIVFKQQDDFDKIFEELIQELNRQGVRIVTDVEASEAQKEFVHQYFEEKVRTEIVPLMIESIPHLPLLNDRSIYLACVLGSETNPMLKRFALIEIPTKVLPRFIIIPSERAGKHNIMLLEDIIRLNLPYIFAPFGFNKFLGYIIKVTRNAELNIDNDVNENLIQALEKGLKNRKKGRATRFVYDREIEPGLLNFLTKRLHLSNKDNLIPGGRIHNYKDFINFPSQVFTKLEKPIKPLAHQGLIQPVRILDVLDKKDVLLHFPYHSFDPVIDLLREAAIDPYVFEIDITAYRLAQHSKVINALINAVRNGKKVTVILELKARFDEEANLKWNQKLEEEGVKVYHGKTGMKTHAKLCLIKKREFGKLKKYAFISTGNIHENTAKLYGDHCLMTSENKITKEVQQVFKVLKNDNPKLEGLKSFQYLVHSPAHMRQVFLNLIDKEMANKKAGHEAYIILKMNSLVDATLLYKLYDAAAAGVKVDLIVRGICCANINLPELKGNMTAVSIVDEYLEHARVFVFANKKHPKVYLSSADWMVRNLDHRIEVATPVLDQKLAEEMIDILQIQLADNVKSRILDDRLANDYVRPKNGEPLLKSQEAIYDYLKLKT